MDQLLFSSASILDLLANIEELSNHSIDMTENESGVVITIGDSAYEIKANDATEIAVDEEVVEEIDDVVCDAFDELDIDVTTEDVEGGPIKELFKTLMLGGMVKMTAKALKNA